jgi:hypothetical protein
LILLTETMLTPARQTMVDLWEPHIAAEFTSDSLDAALATMVAEQSVPRNALIARAEQRR